MFLSSNMMDIKLLLIEDDEDDYVLTRHLLDELAAGQYTLDWASSAAEGAAALARNEHDVCLLDYRLGQEDGLTLLEQAPELGFSGPIIMLTGQEDPEIDSSALRAGAVDYLVKSQLNGARLARAIRYAVARRDVERERLERLRVEAESRSKSEFLAHLSHELRTPLTAILGYTDILLHRDPDRKSESDLQTIKRNGQHLLSLLNDVLDLSKIAAGKLEINTQEVELSGFLADLRSLMEVSAREKGLSLRIVADEVLPPSIQTDPIRLRQILINLVGNAIKFTERGFVEVRISVPDPASSQIEFTVRDTGVGIESRDIEKLFQPFSQGDGKQHLGAEQGSGLGLTISKQLAARLGGDIRVTSVPGQGSTFFLSIEAGPLDPGSFEPLVTTRKPDPASAKHLIRISGHILVVDDLPDIRHLLGEIIAGAGGRVDYASDGEESLRRFDEACESRDPFDLIIMDMQMPSVDGLTASRRLRSRGCQCPILALTAATMQGEKERCMAAGCDDYLSKPVDEVKLLQCVQDLLARGGCGKTEPPKPGRQVLLVEDNLDARRATREILELLGWRVIEAASGAEAREAVHKESPLLALVDVSLPDMNGYDLIRELRKQGLESTRFVTLSGHAVDAERAKEACVSAHLIKPLGLSELQQALEEIN